MKTNRTFKMNGKIYNSMMDIARELGIKRVYPRDFDKLGIQELTGDVDTVDTVDTVKVVEVNTQVAKEKKPVSKHIRRIGTPEQIKEAQDSVTKVGVIEFNNLIKHFTISSLITMAEEIGVNTWDTITNEPIRKMRLLMEIKAHYYPNDKTPVKPTSDWKKLELNELIKIADEHNLDYKVSEDSKIQRMWVTLALNKAGFNPSDYLRPKKAQEDIVDA